jgi:low temperature requirement protein LtrA
VWVLILAQEAGLLLLGRKPRRAGRTGRDEALRAMLKPPGEAGLRIDASHLSERFGLFMIILFGEIVVSVGGSAILVEDRGPAYWIAVLSGFVLAAALWWIYFASAAEINEHVLRASGGNPAVAYGLYAGGHLGPAFALLVMAAGVTLALERDPPGSAGWLIAGGLAVYLVGTQAVVPPLSMRFGRLVRILAVGATLGLGLLQSWITAPGVLLVATLWTVVAAAVVTWHHPARLTRVAADPLSVLRDR